MNRNRVIGSEGEIPWHLPADLEHFREITIGHPVIMGRKTHESIGKPLDQRLNIVLTRNRDYETFGECELVYSAEEAVRRAEDSESKECMVIGGESVYELFLPRAKRLYLTLVENERPGSVYFPELNQDEWSVTSVKQHKADSENPFHFRFYTLIRQVSNKDQISAEQSPPASLFS